MTVNIDLLNRVFKRIERDLSMWDQNSWAHAEKLGLVNRQMPKVVKQNPNDHVDTVFSIVDDITAPMCGTTMCLAGHTVVESGDKLLFDADDDYVTDFCLTPDGKVRSIMERAAELLGLDKDSNEVGIFGAGLGHGHDGYGEYYLKNFKTFVEERLNVTLD